MALWSFLVRKIELLQVNLFGNICVKELLLLEIEVFKDHIQLSRCVFEHLLLDCLLQFNNILV